MPKMLYTYKVARILRKLLPWKDVRWWIPLALNEVDKIKKKRYISSLSLQCGS